MGMKGTWFVTKKATLNRFMFLFFPDDERDGNMRDVCCGRLFIVLREYEKMNKENHSKEACC